MEYSKKDFKLKKRVNYGYHKTRAHQYGSYEIVEYEYYTYDIFYKNKVFKTNQTIAQINDFLTCNLKSGQRILNSVKIAEAEQLKIKEQQKLLDLRCKKVVNELYKLEDKITNFYKNIEEIKN